MIDDVRHNGLRFVAIVSVAVLGACSAEMQRDRGGIAAPSGGRPGLPLAGNGPGPSQPFPGGPSGLAGAPAAAGTPAPWVRPDDPEMCAGASVTAPPAGQPKVDIVWIVDASGSMLDEQMKIGANLTQFAEQITMANIDVRIVMMTTSAAIPVICPVTSPDPMAGTPLAGDARYRFLDSPVGSENALDVAMSSFPQYTDFLRPEAVTHFVVVTDDESRYKGLPDATQRAEAFRTDMRGLLGKDFVVHTIASEGPAPCGDQNCMPDPNTGICFFVMLGCGAAAPGATYYELAGMTQGLTASICQADWKSIFMPLTAAVIESAPLPCNYRIPPAPPGQNLDPAKVNVRWTSPARQEEIFGRATDQAACGDKPGWYYDDPSQPAEVLLCPAACERIAQGGTIDVAFGCETILLL